MNRIMIGIGVVLLVLGVVLLGGMLMRRPSAEASPHTPLIGEYQGVGGNAPSLFWPAAAGISLAAGAACIGLGMNRWHQGSR
jgi:hypothetical protein